MVLLAAIVGLVSLAGILISLAFIFGVLYGNLYWKDLQPSNFLREWGGWNLYKSWVSFSLKNKAGQTFKTVAEYQTFVSRSYVNPPQFVYACYPHGLFAVAPFLAFCATGTNWTGSAPFVLVHSLLLKIPLLRELAFWMGCSSIERQNFEQKLQTDQPLALVPGGVREMILNFKGKMAVDPPNHIGFLKLIYNSKKDVAVVPCWSPSENKLFWTWDVFQGLRLLSTQKIRYPFPTFFVGPLPVDLTMYFGKPVLVKKFDKFDSFCSAFFDELTSLKQQFST